LSRGPQSTVNRRDWGKITLGIGGILGCAAAIAWAVVSVPSGRLLLGSDVVGASFLENLVSTIGQSIFPRRYRRTGNATSRRTRHRNKEICKNRGADPIRASHPARPSLLSPRLSQCR